MATDGPVMRFNNVQYSSGDERLVFAALLGGLGGGPFSARSGKRPGPGLDATVSGLNVTVTPGAGVIYDPTYSVAGPYLFANAANRTFALSARPGSGQSRIDLIVARITDPDTVGGDAEVKIQAITGTASPTPSVPALPPMSMELARATVPASGAVVFSPSSARTVAAGGILPVATDNERDLLPSPHDGLVVYNTQAKRLQYREGGAWVSVPKQVPRTSWVNLDYGTGWEAGSGRPPAQYCQDGDYGLMRGTATGAFANPADWRRITNTPLPADLRPSINVDDLNLGGQNFAWGYVQLRTDGHVWVAPGRSGNVSNITGMSYIGLTLRWPLF